MPLHTLQSEQHHQFFIVEKLLLSDDGPIRAHPPRAPSQSTLPEQQQGWCQCAWAPWAHSPAQEPPPTELQCQPVFRAHVLLPFAGVQRLTHSLLSSVSNF